jgi:hypothetical protein
MAEKDNDLEMNQSFWSMMQEHFILLNTRVSNLCENVPFIDPGVVSLIASLSLPTSISKPFFVDFLGFPSPAFFSSSAVPDAAFYHGERKVNNHKEQNFIVIKQ